MNKVQEMIESARTVMLAALDSLMETEAAAMKDNERQCGRLSCEG